MKYIDAERLQAEIERYKQGAAIARFDNAGENADYFQGKVDLCDDLTHIIASLQQEQPEVDLEREFSREYATYHLPVFILGTLYNGMEVINFIHKTARHFYELGLNARKED